MPSSTEARKNTELSVPAWLTKNFITKVLHSSEKDGSIKLENFKLTPALAQLDHYGSVMYRISVDFVCATHTEIQSKSMIVKALPEFDEKLLEMFKDSHVFETEIGMYDEVIPKFHGILRTIGDETVLGVRCLYHSLSPQKFIIFEDLRTSGYDVLRDRAVSIEEAKIAYLKLAKWHAISYKLSQENSEIFNKFQHSLMNLEANETNATMNDFIDSGISKFIQMLETQPKLRQYKKHFEALQPQLVAKCRASFVEYLEEPQRDEHYVLSHGDFHCKNMMFKHNATNGHIEDVMLLDFQLCHMGPLANDLIYATYMLLDRKLRMDHLSEFLEHYYYNFAHTLRALSYEGQILTLTEFQQSLQKHKYFDHNGMMSSDNSRIQMYLNEAYLVELECILPKYLEMGYLEC